MSGFDVRRALVSRRAVKWLLWTQIALTVSALAVAGASLVYGTSGRGTAVVTGVVVSSSLVAYGVVLVAAGVVGLLALRRDSPTLYLRAIIVLFAPALLALASSLSMSSDDGEIAQDALPAEVWQSTQDTLRLLTWAHGLAFAAVVVAAVSALLLLLLRRTTGRNRPTG